MGVVGVGVVVEVTGVGVGVVVEGVAGVEELTGVVDVEVGVLLELGLVFLEGEELLSVLVGKDGVDVLPPPLPRRSAGAASARVRPYLVINGHSPRGRHRGVR